jgi:hypothetical protein
MRCLQQLPTYTKLRKEHGDFVWYEWRDFTGTVSLSPLAKAELRMWLAHVWKLRGCTLVRRVELVAFTDACGKKVESRVVGGYGAVVATPTGDVRSKSWAVQELLGGSWQNMVDSHSTVFELRTIVGLLDQKGESWQGKRVHVCTDNVGAAFIAGKGCMKEGVLHALAIRLWRVALKWDVDVSTQYLAGDGIILAGADGLSRGEDHFNCVLNKQVFRRLWSWKGPFDVDCCASEGAVQQHPISGVSLPCVSPFLSCAVHRNVLTFVHTGRLYAFPPAPLIARLVAHVVNHGLRMVMVVPDWPTSSWYSSLWNRDRLVLGMVDKVADKGSAGLGHPFGKNFEREWQSVSMLAVAFNL